MASTGLEGIVAALTGTARAAEQQLIFAQYTAQVAAENPTQSYSGKPASVGASAKIVGEEPNEDVIGEPKRTYIAFPPINGNPTKAELTFYATSGTAWSSKNNKMCERPLIIDVHALYDATTVPYLAFSNLTWNNAHAEETLVGKVEIIEPCTTSVEHPHSYTVDVTAAYTNGRKPTAFMLKADAKGELDQHALSTAQERWDNQTDVYIGTVQQGLPASLKLSF